MTGGTGSPKTGRQSPRQQVLHCRQHPTGREGSEGPPQTQSPWGTGVMGDCRGCFKQQLLLSPVQLLQTLPAPAMSTTPGMCGVPTQHSCTRAQPLPPQPQPAAAAEPALQPRAPGNGRRRLSQEGAIRKSKENPSWRSRCSSIFPASMSLLLAWLAAEPSVCAVWRSPAPEHHPHPTRPPALPAAALGPVWVVA